MTTAIVSDSILSSLNGTMVRRGKENFIAIPTEIVDGVQQYTAVKVSTLKTKDTISKTTGAVLASAFDFDSAKSEYEAWKTAFDAKAQSAKSHKGSKSDPAVEARKLARAEWMENWVANTMEEDREYTASEVYDQCDKSIFPTAMMVGSALIAMDGNGIEMHDNGKGEKKTYTKMVR